jgi:hypothetical protein
MRTIIHGTKALIRNPLRGGLLVGVLAVSIGLALIMITVNGAFAQRLDDIRAQVGTTLPCGQPARRRRRLQVRRRWLDSTTTTRQHDYGQPANY